MNLNELEKLLLVLSQFGVISYSDDKVNIQIKAPNNVSNVEYENVVPDLEPNPEIEKLKEDIPAEYLRAFKVS